MKIIWAAKSDLTGSQHVWPLLESVGRTLLENGSQVGRLPEARRASRELQSLGLLRIQQATRLARARESPVELRIAERRFGVMFSTAGTSRPSRWGSWNRFARSGAPTARCWKTSVSSLSPSLPAGSRGASSPCQSTSHAPSRVPPEERTAGARSNRCHMPGKTRSGH